jgi:hypothetical protein
MNDHLGHRRGNFAGLEQALLLNFGEKGMSRMHSKQEGLPMPL